jgi:hypothetical protein
MVIDKITGKTYNAAKCRLCGCEEIYVIHTINPEFLDDVDKDDVFCRCDKCRYVPSERWYLPDKHFNNVKEAVDFWNKKMNDKNKILIGEKYESM